ncbi:hypothetical protein ABPG74_006731, partial [Tetrahymena malaccensis]
MSEKLIQFKDDVPIVLKSFKMTETKISEKLIILKIKDLPIPLNSFLSTQTKILINANYQKLADDNILSTLGIALAGCTSISRISINLQSSKFKLKGVSSLVSSLAYCTNLTYLFLQLEQNSFNKSTLDFGSGFSNLSTLELFIGKNYIDTENYSRLHMSLAMCFKLTNLYLNIQDNFYYNIGNEKCNGLSSCINLQYLNLQFSTFTVNKSGLNREGNLYLISSLRNLVKLQKFICNVKGENDEEIASLLGSALISCISLEFLDISYRFEKNFEKSIAGFSSQLSNCSNLSSIKLDLRQSFKDEISYETTSALSQNLAKCPKLTHLQLNI